MENSSAWLTSTSGTSSGTAAPRATSVIDQPSSGANAASHSAQRAAKTGAVSSSSTAMPSHWAP